jgi:hypothetical protein
MESLRDMNRVIEREIQKGSCPLCFEQKGFGEYSYNEISSKEKLTEVLSYLLRIGEFEQYATKMVMSNIYMDVKYGKLEYHRTHIELERKKIYATILRYTKKLNPEYEGKVYLETVRCFFTIPPVEREKCKMTYQGEDAIGMILTKKHILALFTHCLVARASDAGEQHTRSGLLEKENEMIHLSNVQTGLFQTLLMDDVKFEEGRIYTNLCTIYLLK